MQNKWLFRLGYKHICMDRENLKKAISLLRGEGISFHANASGDAYIPFFLWHRATVILKDKVVFNEHCYGGAISLLTNALEHLGAVSAATLFIVFYLFVSRFVFDVRIEGNELYTSEELLEEIGNGGLYAGARWDEIDLDALENRILQHSDQIAWVNINRRGLVAYVSLREREGALDEAPVGGYSNIVSRFDGVVEDITVGKGSSSVGVGSTVQRGDLLISAFDEGGRLTGASGSVSARVWGEVFVFIPREEEIAVKKEYRTVQNSLKILNFTINILKNYRNLPSEYDIIEDERQILLARGKALPIKLYSAYAVLESKERVVRTDEELVRLARRAHESALLSYLSGAELVSIRTNTTFTEEGYAVRSQICMLKEIGESVPLIP